MSKQLVIVESPAKAKTIEKYLGNTYEVKSSFGHIRDLPKKNLSIDVENDFKPSYQISADKKKVVDSLKKAAKASQDVWLASDEDREGEAIAWHLCYALGLDPKTTKRIVFHEITKSAITNAIENPRTIDLNLVDAQQARRILDRLVGYELSPVLWKKVRPGLSAGRVQSVAVRLIVEREREITGFEHSSKFRVTATFTGKGIELPAELDNRFDTPDQTKKFLEDANKAKFAVEKVEKKPGKRSPGAPFTTSSLQQEAARQLGYSVKQTMTLAQRLYENGHITYMRTDSTTLSGLALDDAKKYITKTYGANYHNLRQYKTKQSNAQEAHEAIRPTDFSQLSLGDDEGQTKLYKLIWRRALASQMADAKLDRTEILVSINNRSEKFLAKGEIVSFDGFLKVYGRTGEDVLLPELKVGQELNAETIIGRQTFAKPPARYSEASLVRKLEELGIGRPSTYAPTISTIQSREYITKKDSEGKTREVSVLTLDKGQISENTEEETYDVDRGKLIPTPLADVTTDFLTKNFAEVVDYDFTANAEKDLDLIAEGKEKWVEAIRKFYGNFHKLVEKSEDVSREESTQTRQLGIDPKTKKPILARYGRYGPMLQRGETADEEKPAFASLPVDKTLDTVTLEDALEMFKLPREVGKTKEGEAIQANIGRYGPYIQVGKTFVSIKPLDPLSITEEEANDLYEKRKATDANKNIKEFSGGVKVLNGPYGPYVTNGKRNVKIPKDVDENAITEEEAKKLLKQPPSRKAPPRRRKSGSKRKTT
jgi:DNA topoisomerase-1